MAHPLPVCGFKTLRCPPVSCLRDAMRRRDLITLLSVTGGAWPLVARAQQAAIPMIGYLHGGSPAPFAHLMGEFRSALRESGYIEGQNVKIEYRWAEGQYDRLPE